MDELFGWDEGIQADTADACQHELVMDEQSCHCLHCGFTVDTSLLNRRTPSDKDCLIEVDSQLAITGKLKDQKKLIESLERILNNVNNQNLKVTIPGFLLPEIANAILTISSGSQHRGLSLVAIMAAAAKFVASKHHIYIEDNSIATMFGTAKGLSTGRNAYLLSRAAINMQNGINYVTNIDTYKDAYNSIAMCCVRINDCSKSVVRFVIALATIADLTQEVESQVVPTRFGGSYLYYRLVYTDANCETLIPIICSNCSTTPETINKYYKKLMPIANVIDRIALKTGIISEPSDPAVLQQKMIYKYKVKK